MLNTLHITILIGLLRSNRLPASLVEILKSILESELFAILKTNCSKYVSCGRMAEINVLHLFTLISQDFNDFQFFWFFPTLSFSSYVSENRNTVLFSVSFFFLKKEL